MKIRRATTEDYEAVWQIFEAVIKTGDTYVFDPATPKSELKKHWFDSNIYTFVLEEEGAILGTYILKANQIDLGNHIANGAYMVHPNAQGKGIGKKMCEHSLVQAKELGFLAIQFNFVISTNEQAVKLWKKYGFEIIGTIPKAFRHSNLGFVDAYIMHKTL